jgi:hypothetical protein
MGGANQGIVGQPKSGSCGRRESAIGVRLNRS